MSITVKTRDDISIRKILEEHANCMQCWGEKFYFLPFWFKDDGTDHFEMLHLDHLPEGLKKAIQMLRDTENKSIVTYPLMKKESFKPEIGFFRWNLNGTVSWIADPDGGYLLYPDIILDRENKVGIDFGSDKGKITEVADKRRKELWP